jgi:hypothetical protein
MTEQEKAAVTIKEIGERNKRVAEKISKEIAWEKTNPGQKDIDLDIHLETFELNIERQNEIAEKELKGKDNAVYQEKMESIKKQEYCLDKFRNDRNDRNGHDEKEDVKEKTIERVSGKEKEQMTKLSIQKTQNATGLKQEYKGVAKIEKEEEKEYDREI